MDQSDVVEETLLLAALIQDEQQPRYVTAYKRRREEEGEFHTLYQQLRQHEERFYIYFRMTIECFDEILYLIKGDIQKEYTNYRKPIEPAECLAVALRYLATGDSYSTIGHSFRIGFSSVSIIVEEVCNAIWKRLQPICLPEPTWEIRERTISSFQDVWRFPNYLGSIYGTRVAVKCPDKTGSAYFSYLHKFSINLMAIVDHNYTFLFIDVGGYEKNSDGGVFEASAMGQKLLNGTLNTPRDRPLPEQNEPTPGVLIGDEAFPLGPNLLRPFPYRQSRHGKNKHVYNKRLCRARRVVEKIPLVF
ncbi:hypothetical protein PR048_010606 [Dryococelus australis]|uniref:DDE Tnp4 domain-containing protein n=1 Tax=Dryococelus australis TaxID=614101 RepID=A0ABQ9I408_9NEOP|nr:hypothetical protein PR048_010606 [Dryococelus australis]